MRKHYLLVSDFDQTLSFNDSGLALSEMLGIPAFQDKVAALSRMNLVQQGAELAYLLQHDPEFRRVRETVFRVSSTLAVTLLLITLLFAVIAVIGAVDPAVPGL